MLTYARKLLKGRSRNVFQLEMTGLVDRLGNPGTEKVTGEHCGPRAERFQLSGRVGQLLRGAFRSIADALSGGLRLWRSLRPS